MLTTLTAGSLFCSHARGAAIRLALPSSPSESLSSAHRVPLAACPPVLRGGPQNTGGQAASGTRTATLIACLAACLALAPAWAQVSPVIPPVEVPVPGKGPRVSARLAETTSLIRADQARTTFSVNGSGLAVAVLDTGLRTTHIDVAGRVLAQLNYTADNGGDPNNATDGQGHGTNVAGIIVANGGVSGHTGIAPGAGVIPMKVLDNTGSGSLLDAVEALDWVIANRTTYNITVVNMSLGNGENYSTLPDDSAIGLRQRIQTLRAAKVAVVISAGNSFYQKGSAQGMEYPAIIPESMSVGAVYDADIGGPINYASGAVATTTGADRLCPFSQRFHQDSDATLRTDIFAPGAALTSSGIADDTASSTMHGTSQSAPVAAGVLLLMQQRYLNLTGQLPTVDQLETWLRGSAVNIVDGDDENDNVTNTGKTFLRSDALAAVGQVTAATKLRFTVQPANTAAGGTITPAVQVEVLDAADTRVTAGSFQIALAIGTNPGAGVLSGTATQTSANGVATFPDLSIDRPGNGYTLTASAPNLTGATSNAFNISSATGEKLVFTVQPATTVAGQAIAPAVQVQAQDAGGNPLTGYSQAITLGLGANPGGGTLSGTVSRTPVNGVATFADLSLDKSGTGYTLVASSGALTPDTSAAFDITAGPAARLAFTVQPSNTTAGAAITPAVSVTVQDALGNTVTGSTATVGLAIGTNPGGGTLSGTVSRAATAGVATFADLSLDKAGTGYTLSASSTGLTAATSAAFDITAGAAAKLAFVVEPTSATAGTALSPAVQVAVQDAAGNLVTGATNGLTLAIETNPGGATLAGTVTRNATAGVGTFDDLSLDKAGVGYTLRATATGLTSAVSAAFTISPGAGAQLRFRVQPTTSTAGVAISPAVEVVVEDALGNLATGAANSVALTLGNNPGGGTLSGTTVKAAVGGVATFADLSIDQPGVGYTLNAGATGVNGATSAAFEIQPGVAAKLAFQVQPTQVVAGQAIAPAVQVAVQDAQGNTVLGAANPVTIELGASPAGATLSGTLTTAASNGTAQFGDLSLNKIGTGLTLKATATGLTEAVSEGFAVVAGAASASASTTGASPTSVVADDMRLASVTITLIDSFGNAVAGVAPSAFSLTSTPSFGVTIAGPASPTNAAGQTVATVRSARPGVKVITVTVSGTALTQSASITFTPRVVDAAKTTLTVEPALIASNGQALATVTVTLRDASGAPVIGSTAADRSVAIAGTATNGSGMTIATMGGETGDDGLFQVQVKSITPDTYTVTVTVSGVALATVTVRSQVLLSAAVPAGVSFLALPITPEDPRPLGVLGDSGYQLARYDPPANQFLKFTPAANDDPAFAFQLCRGHFVRFDSARTLKVYGTPSMDQPYDVTLRLGWNALGNPYVAAMPWDLDRMQVILPNRTTTLGDSTVWGYVAPYCWILDGTGYRLVFDPAQPQFANSLDAVPRLAGFWVYSAFDGAILRLAPPVVTGRATRSVTARSWAVDLTATAAGGGEGCTVGVTEDATRALRLERPPAVDPPAVELSVVRDGRRAAGELVPWQGRALSWDLSAASRDAGEVTLAWPGLLRQLPRGLVVELTDQQTGRVVLLNTRAAYRYAAQAGERRRLKLTARFGHLDRSEIQSVTVTASRGGGSTITLTLTGPADVTVTVRGLGGRLVRHLVQPGVGAGTVAIAWDGADDQARPVPAGSYLVEVTAVSANGAVSRAARAVSVP